MMLITTMLTDTERVNTVSAVSATVYYSFRENKNQTTVSRFASFCTAAICAVPPQSTRKRGNLGSLIHPEILPAYHV